MEFIDEYIEYFRLVMVACFVAGGFALGYIFRKIQEDYDDAK